MSLNRSKCLTDATHIDAWHQLYLKPLQILYGKIQPFVHFIRVRSTTDRSRAFAASLASDCNDNGICPVAGAGSLFGEILFRRQSQKTIPT